MFIDVALPLPIPRSFTYAVPAELRGGIQPGVRVLVPFANRERIGWVDAVRDEPPAAPERVKPIAAVLDVEPSATPAVLRLARWIADYYVAPLGQVLRTALPAGLANASTDQLLLTTAGADADVDALPEKQRRVVEWLRERDGAQPVARLRRELGDRVWWPTLRALEAAGLVRTGQEPPRLQPPMRVRRFVRITDPLPGIALREQTFGRARRQRELFELIEGLGGRADVAHLTGALGYSHALVRALVERRIAEVAEEMVPRDPYAGIDAPPPHIHDPTPAQAEVIAALVRAARAPEPGTTLLRGVTGSGKTLVYIELLRDVVDRQRRTAIVLVPEIALTPQTVGRFKSVFGDRVAVLHSALSDGERYDEWRALRAGEKRIVVGARSAIFAPLPELGAIIVDEEHESSYKQGEAPRYHAREAAVVRARQEGALCMLGSATPSLESWANARAGKYQLLELPERVGGQALPPIRVVDLRAERRRQHASSGPLQERAPTILSDALVEAVHARLRRGEQTILLLNRRGYATFVQCRACGLVWHCPHCNVSLTYHRRRGRLTCHYCLHEEVAPALCTGCGADDLSFRGVGTEQVERAVGEAFPSARLARMDVDTTGAKWAHHDILRRVEHREVDILLGTQMIAKGLDFPNVTLVGVVNADVGINLPDFRATERTFQLLTQVAGRAGRGPKGGEVFIQTALPTHYAVTCATGHDFVGFAEREMEARRDPIYPPHCRLVNVVVSGLEEAAVQEAAAGAATALEAWLAGRAGAGGVQIIGPAPCAIDRLRGRWRWHFILRAGRARALGDAAHWLLERYALPGGRAELRLAIDRDPVQLL